MLEPVREIPIHTQNELVLPSGMELPREPLSSIELIKCGKSKRSRVFDCVWNFRKEVCGIPKTIDPSQPRTPDHLTHIAQFAARCNELSPQQREIIDQITGTPENYALLRGAGRMRAYSGGIADAKNTALREEALEVKAALVWIALNYNRLIHELANGQK